MTRQTDRSSSENAHCGALRNAGGAANGSSAEQGITSGAGKFLPLLLGHRRARAVPRLTLSKAAGKVPTENTLAAFEYALAHGCDGFEFDVRITRDERLVLCHDASLRGRKVAASSYDSLCSRCNEELPCLEDVLVAFGDRAYLDIEVKARGGEELIVAALRRRKPKRCLLSSFLPEVLVRFHELYPSLPLGYICDRKQVCLRRSCRLRCSFRSTSWSVRRWYARPITAACRVHLAVNREEDMRRLAAWGVDGLISDDPGLLARTFASPTPARKSE